MEVSTKCFNLDWLEVFCIEPFAMSAQWFKQQGWNVQKREYGTPSYREMFVLLNQNGTPFLEIRRDPFSLKRNGGIFADGACHIRLSNRTLYSNNPVQQLQQFLVKYRYTFKGISRVDVCCDQVTFDNGMKPSQLAEGFMNGSIIKNRNSHISAHGTITKSDKAWNSLKWGSPSSPLSTKLYDKTLELSQNAEKFYIKNMWQQQGLCDFQKCTYEYTDKKTKETTTRSKMVIVGKGDAVNNEIPLEIATPISIWRVEFSIKSEARSWVSLDGGKKISVTLDKFSSRSRIALMFLLLAQWCMDFRKAEYTRNGTMQKKDRCTPLDLYSQKNLAYVFKPHRLTEKEDASRTDKIMYNRLMHYVGDNCHIYTDQDKATLTAAANLLITSKGRWWVSNENQQRIADRVKIDKDAADHQRMILENFRSMSWVEKFNAQVLSDKERNYIKRRAKHYITILLQQAKNELKKAEDKAAWARGEIKYWSGQTMPIQYRQAIFDCPF